MTEQDLLQLKQEIDEAKTEISKLEGAKQTLMQQAKEKWNCSSAAELETLLSKWKEEASTLNTQIVNRLKDLEEQMEENMN